MWGNLTVTFGGGVNLSGTYRELTKEDKEVIRKYSRFILHLLINLAKERPDIQQEFTPEVIGQLGDAVPRLDGPVDLSILEEKQRVHLKALTGEVIVSQGEVLQLCDELTECLQFTQAKLSDWAAKRWETLVGCLSKCGARVREDYEGWNLLEVFLNSGHGLLAEFNCEPVVDRGIIERVNSALPADLRPSEHMRDDTRAWLPLKDETGKLRRFLYFTYDGMAMFSLKGLGFDIRRVVKEHRQPVRSVRERSSARVPDRE